METTVMMPLLPPPLVHQLRLRSFNRLFSMTGNPGNRGFGRYVRCRIAKVVGVLPIDVQVDAARPLPFACWAITDEHEKKVCLACRGSMCPRPCEASWKHRRRDFFFHQKMESCSLQNDRHTCLLSTSFLVWYF